MSHKGKNLVEYIESVSNPFSKDASSKLIHLTTLEAVDDVDVLLSNFEQGHASWYESFVEERLVQKNKGVRDIISLMS